MFAIILILAAVVFTIMNIYIMTRIFGWFKSVWPGVNGIVFAVIYLMFPVFLLAGQKLPWCLATKVMKYIGTYWLGAFLYLIMFVILAEVLLLILKKAKVISKDFMEKGHNRSWIGLGVIACTVVILAVGFISFSKIALTEYDVHIDKYPRASHAQETANTPNYKNGLDITMFADVHLGATCGKDKVAKIVEEVNAQDPDLICIPGDIFDISVYSIEDRDEIADELAKLDADCGVYACLGNHDVSWYSKDAKEKKEFEEFFERAGITLLNDESVEIKNSFWLAGRIDKSPSGYKGKVIRKTAEAMTEGIDMSMPVILLDHQPDQLQQEANARFDLVLSGHTHGGQTWPGTLMVNFMGDNGYGCKAVGDMTSVVTSGVGVWGPPLRVGSQCEITNVHVEFKQD